MFTLRKLVRRWQRKGAHTTDALWQAALRQHPYACALDAGAQARLRFLVDEFLALKSIEGAHGLAINDEMRAQVALRACVPILQLGLDYYNTWYSVVLYPGDFRVHDEFTDEAGVVHHGTRDLCGESMTQGPVVLSWQAIEEDIEMAELDIVVHECAHKLDLLNGEANGFPPLHAGMSVEDWAQSLTAAFEAFCEQVEHGHPTRLDPYAATDPAEFFACLSETFFTAPAVIVDDFPAVYAQLCRFYRQDPQAVSKTIRQT